MIIHMHSLFIDDYVGEPLQDASRNRYIFDSPFMCKHLGKLIINIHMQLNRWDSFMDVKCVLL